jgi:putative oxidoreductase
MKKLISLSFLPSSPDCALLALRVWLGLSMFLIHGKAKLLDFSGQLEKFKGLGIPAVFGSAAIVAESICALLLVIGLATRLSAAFLAATMAFAFYKAHKLVLSGPGSGELAFVYLGGFVALLLAGAGRFALDSKILK